MLFDSKLTPSRTQGSIAPMRQSIGNAIMVSECVRWCQYSMILNTVYDWLFPKLQLSPRSCFECCTVVILRVSCQCLLGFHMFPWDA